MIYRLFWPFDDPAAVEGSEAEKLATLREVRDQIESRIQEWMLQYKLKPQEVRQRQG